MPSKGKLLYFSRALELRAEAMRCARQARSHPIGTERNELRHVASALKALSEAEAWLHGEIAPPRRRHASTAKLRRR